MAWDESKHPRDDIGRFTYSDGSDSENNSKNDTQALKGRIEKTEVKSPAEILYGDTHKKEKAENEYRSNLLNILGDKARPTDVLYGTTKELEEKIKECRLQNKLKGAMAGGASGINKQKISNKTGDYGFSESIWNLPYYNKLSIEYDKEVGEFLRNNTNNPKEFSNDIRHQFVSAIFARNLGEDVAKRFGDINELKPADLLDPVDSKIDKINNEIGRQYAKQYPNMPRKQLLELMLKEYPQSKQIIIQKMNEKTEKQKKLEREYL